MIVNKGVFLNVNKVIFILRVMEFSHTPVGGDTFSPPILCGHREDFKVLTFSDVFGDLHRMVSRSPPHLFISIEMT